MGLFDGAVGAAGAAAAPATGGLSLIPSLISGAGSLLGGLFGGGGGGRSNSFSDNGTQTQQGLTSPVNSLYNAIRDNMGLGQALAQRASQPINIPGAGINTPSFSVGGLKLGGNNVNVAPTTLPGLNLPADLFQPPPAAPDIQAQLDQLQSQSKTDGGEWTPQGRADVKKMNAFKQSLPVTYQGINS